MKQTEALQWIATVFDDVPDRIKPSTARKEIAGWDSMGTLMLIAELDEKFDIHLDEAQIEKLTSVDDILLILREHGSLEFA